MANIQALFDAVLEAAVERKKVKVELTSRSEHETARTRLVTLWSEHKQVILAVGGEDSDPLYPLSLCASFDEQIESGSVGGNDDTSNGSCRSEFWLGKPRRKMAKSYSFSIVEETPSATLVDTIPEAANESQSPNTETSELRLAKVSE